jgi:hypothetical protein
MPEEAPVTMTFFCFIPSSSVFTVPYVCRFEYGQN